MSTAASAPLTQQQRESAELYHSDPYAWSVEQSEALRKRDFAAVDWENVIEEIESLGRTEGRSLKSQYARVMEHFLKLQYRGDEETEPVAGWESSVNQARVEIEEALQESPRLKSKRDEVLARGWLSARRAVIEAFAHHAIAGIRDDSMRHREQKRLTREWSQTLPQTNPYTREQVEDSFWMPERTRLAQHPQSPRQPVRKSDGSR